MVEILTFQDPVIRALDYLRDYVDGTLVGEVPYDWDWERNEILVVVTDTGGAGERDVVLDDTWLTLSVGHPDSVVASEQAGVVHGLLRAWPYEESGVRFLRTIQRPTFVADSETRYPSYEMTVELSFRAIRREIHKK